VTARLVAAQQLDAIQRMAQDARARFGARGDVVEVVEAIAQMVVMLVTPCRCTHLFAVHGADSPHACTECRCGYSGQDCDCVSFTAAEPPFERTDP
jgi:hypothetical protein